MRKKNKEIVWNLQDFNSYFEKQWMEWFKWQKKLEK